MYTVCIRYGRFDSRRRLNDSRHEFSPSACQGLRRCGGARSKTHDRKTCVKPVMNVIE